MWTTGFPCLDYFLIYNFAFKKKVLGSLAATAYIGINNNIWLPLHSDSFRTINDKAATFFVLTKDPRFKMSAPYSFNLFIYLKTSTAIVFVVFVHFPVTKVDFKKVKIKRFFYFYEVTVLV